MEIIYISHLDYLLSEEEVWASNAQLALYQAMKIIHIKHTNWSIENDNNIKNEFCAGNARRALSYALSKQGKVCRVGHNQVEDWDLINSFDVVLFNITAENFSSLFKITAPVLGILTEMRHDFDWFGERRNELWDALHRCKGIWTMASLIPVENAINYPLPVSKDFYNQAQLHEKGNYGITGFWDGWGGCITSAKILSDLGLTVIIPTQNESLTLDTCLKLGINIETMGITCLLGHTQAISKCRIGLQLSHENRAGGATVKAAFTKTPFMSTKSEYWANILFPELIIYTPQEAYTMGKRLLSDQAFYNEIVDLGYERFMACSIENPKYISGLIDIVEDFINS